MNTFQLATGILLVFTLTCIGINIAGWMRLRALVGLLGGTDGLSPEDVNRKIKGVGQLRSLIRWEGAYFTALLVYVLIYPGVLAIIPVLFVVFYHWLGLLVNEATSATHRLYERLKVRHPLPESRRKITFALLVIGLLDGAEFLILGYIVWACFRSMG